MFSDCNFNANFFQSIFIGFCFSSPSSKSIVFHGTIPWRSGCGSFICFCFFMTAFHPVCKGSGSDFDSFRLAQHSACQNITCPFGNSSISTGVIGNISSPQPLLQHGCFNWTNNQCLGCNKSCPIFTLYKTILAVLFFFSLSHNMPDSIQSGWNCGLLLRPPIRLCRRHQKDQGRCQFVDIRRICTDE